MSVSYVDMSAHDVHEIKITRHKAGLTRWVRIEALGADGNIANGLKVAAFSDMSHDFPHIEIVEEAEDHG